MPRSEDIQRVELRLRTDDPMVIELMEEANKRGVLLQQHIFDLLMARYLARRGDSLQALLWIPSAPETEQTPNGSDSQVDETVQESADFWLNMQ